MKIDRELILKLERLSNLSLSEEERQEMQKDLESMLGMVNKLDELDLEGVEPLVHISDEVNVLREDKVENQLSQEEALKNATKKDKQFFLVPNVMKNKK
ncbi:MAG: Asp-tRNA(Asn)/Glu-tRNA(Gln) amidotransferase subunit GatC [Saprospiraceae bacterium]